MGGAPSSTSALALTPMESTTSGSRDLGMCSASRISSSHADWPGVRSPVSAALVESVRWAVPPERVHTSQESTVRNTAPGVGLGRAGRAGGRAWWPTGSGPGECPALQHEAIAERAQILPTETGSERLAGDPIPQHRRCPLVGHADRVDRSTVGQAARATSSAAAASTAGSNSTKPWAGEMGSTSR